MKPSKSTIKMPELLVFTKLLVIGFLGSEIWRIAYYLGTNFEPTISNIGFYYKFSGIFLIVLLCLSYVIHRGGVGTIIKFVRSFRLDLLIAIGIGIWINILVTPWLSKAHLAIKNVDPQWTLAIIIMLCTILFSPFFQKWLQRTKASTSQLYFISDEEIYEEKDDLLKIDKQAKSFAEAVLASGAHTGLVFGVDGAWGVGKTSFMNLAQRYWENSKEKVIVCRFEPLRYASEPDLANRIIRDLSDAIQRQVFAPEFRPTASRYARLIKGKADISFLGFKLSLEPSQETVDDLLDDIDESLKRIGRRVIIVIDDLDRLDAMTINNVLFATRQTFKLTQATYVLCYDTELLAGNMEEGTRAREFLEKFVTIKQSLFVDSSSIRDFLRRDWQRPENQLGSIPSDRMIKLGSILNELADILDSELASDYLPVLGDFRKVKRFVNSMLIMRLEEIDLGQTDFNNRDLINLMLIHLNYPGLFRRIYGEETDERRGIFSVRREFGEKNYTNSDKFLEFLGEQKKTESYLLKQLFEVNTLNLSNLNSNDEAFLASRACFNHQYARNLEKYLKLLVRFITPEPQETFILYHKAVERVRAGASIASVLSSNDFELKKSEHGHDQFWSMLANNSHDFTDTTAEDAINTLVDYLPRYSAIGYDSRGLRQTSIYTLLRLLDNAGWGRTKGRRLSNTKDNVKEIAWRIFGEHHHENKSLLHRLGSDDRGILGWNDLMIFRLSCSADRQGQLFNLHTALNVHQDEKAATTGNVSNLATQGMRKLSQEVFAFFKRTYITSGRNFFSEVNSAPDEDFLGEAMSQPELIAEGNLNFEGISINDRISATRTAVKSFVIYQLSNKFPPNGAGVGCGYYDEHGSEDGGHIAKLMNEYIFDFCFNPKIHEDNTYLFLDYCLSHLSNPFFSDNSDEETYFPSKDEISKGLDADKMGWYWCQHQEHIRQIVQNLEERFVFTTNYRASYRDDLPKVFKVLDELAEDLKE